MQRGQRLTFGQLSTWHQEMFSHLFMATFPGKDELRQQILMATFEMIDDAQSLSIHPTKFLDAKVTERIPVEARAKIDNYPVTVYLFVKRGCAYMLEIVRTDTMVHKSLPPASEFEIIVNI